MTDKDLVLRTIEGDNSTFEELVSRYDARVLAIAYNYVNSMDDAKDIYQEVFIRVYNGLAGFEFRSEFSTWLYRITVNVCLTFSRKHRMQNYLTINENNENYEYSEQVEKIEGSSYADEGLLHNELLDYIKVVIDNLPEKQKMIFNLKYFHDYKLREIAEIMKTTEGTVKKLLSIAINKLRESIKNHFDLPVKK